uniref:Uncharacterized protein n=1 Tax=Cacopsylla melanoneura TaxID=428564 RepID=A0A8D8WKE4_9HEMI
MRTIIYTGIRMFYLILSDPKPPPVAMIAMTATTPTARLLITLLLSKNIPTITATVVDIPTIYLPPEEQCSLTLVQPHPGYSSHPELRGAQPGALLINRARSHNNPIVTVVTQIECDNGHTHRTR